MKNSAQILEEFHKNLVILWFFNSNLNYWIPSLSYRILIEILEEFHNNFWYKNLIILINIYEYNWIYSKLFKIPTSAYSLKTFSSLFLYLLSSLTYFHYILCLQQTCCRLFWNVTFCFYVHFPEGAKTFASNLCPKMKIERVRFDSRIFWTQNMYFTSLFF